MIAKATSEDKNDTWKLLCAIYAIARDSDEWKLSATWTFPDSVMTEWSNGKFAIRAISRNEYNYHEFEMKQIESEVKP